MALAKKLETKSDKELHALAAEAIELKAHIVASTKRLKEITAKALPIMIQRAKSAKQKSYTYATGGGFIKYSKITELEISTDDNDRLKNELGEHYAKFIEEKKDVVGKWPEIKEEIANADSTVAAILRKFVNVSSSNKIEVKTNKAMKRKK